MSHQHFCDIAGHGWQCESNECICLCQTKMEQGDHSRCAIELRACSQHDEDQSSSVDRVLGASCGPHETTAVTRPAPGVELEGWERLEPISPDIEEKFEGWAASHRENVGFCFLCGDPIDTADDFIADTNTHNCVEGRAFEEKIRLGKA